MGPALSVAGSCEGVAEAALLDLSAAAAAASQQHPSGFASPGVSMEGGFASFGGNSTLGGGANGGGSMGPGAGIEAEGMGLFGMTRRQVYAFLRHREAIRAWGFLGFLVFPGALAAAAWVQMGPDETRRARMGPMATCLTVYAAQEASICTPAVPGPTLATLPPPPSTMQTCSSPGPVPLTNALCTPCTCTTEILRQAGSAQRLSLLLADGFTLHVYKDRLACCHALALTHLGGALHAALGSGGGPAGSSGAASGGGGGASSGGGLGALLGRGMAK